MEYANQHQITLELNDKNKWGEYSLLWTIYYRNNEMLELLIEYANQHQVILELNEKDENKLYPLELAISKDNIEMTKLLIDYALKHQIVLEYDKTKIVNNSEIQYYEAEKEKWIKVNN